MNHQDISDQPVPLLEPISDEALQRAAMRPLPAISVPAQLLLMCARERLSAEQYDFVIQLCGQIVDWDELIQQSQFRLITALVHYHLSRLPRGLVPEAVVERLKDSARLTMMRNLTMIGVHHRLVREVLGPLDVPYVFFKGPSLAYQYYLNPSLRQFRDIDLLIPRKRIVEVGQRLRELKFYSSPDRRLASDDGLKFLQRFSGMMDWMSLDRVLIEIPTSLDDWGRLPTDEIIKHAETANIGGLSVSVPSPDDFFCYLCKHHSRHHWARLHWIADLNAILAHPSFDVNRIREQASKRGFERTVEAALLIHQAVVTPEPWKAEFKDPFAHEIFRHCLINLDGNFEQELALREMFPASSIDIDPIVRRKEHWIGRNLSRFTPQMEDYLQAPMRSRWHWLYYFIRPFLWCTRKFQRGGVPARENSSNTAPR